MLQQQAFSSNQILRVVLFSGGRGSGVLSKQLARDPRIQLTVAINGYDDGASTGEVRRFLGDSLGPSDFRKNASRLALELGTCTPKVVQVLDSRLPADVSRADAIAALHEARASLPEATAQIDAFLSELIASERPFDFRNCSVGNLVFAGAFLAAHRDFNTAVDDYCRILGLSPGFIENVTDGTNAFLVALGADGKVLGSEEEIVGARQTNRIADIYLIDRALSESDRAALRHAEPDRAAALFETRRARVGLNPRLAQKLARADLVIYAPGTQHSSLFPSYLTPGLSAAIAKNLRAIKLLITNIQADAEIAGSSAVDIIERALYYLKEKGTLRTPTPCLITHYIVNDPGQAEQVTPYVPLGQTDAIEDPRLVRISNYEDGVTGRHDAVKILGPFVRSFLDRRAVQKLAVFLYDAGSLNKVAQSILEMVRGRIQDLPLDATVFYEGEPLDPAFIALLPFGVRVLGTESDRQLRQAVLDDSFDYVVLFESSGMYRGEDVAGLASNLTLGRLDAAWGSRRLSVRDVTESLRVRYRHNAMLRMASYAGSHLLSLSCLALYGRYISDTLSGVRAVRADDAIAIEVPLTHKFANQHLLARLLGRKAEILEMPVQFLPISPERVKRTSIVEGFESLGALVRGRLRTPRPPQIASAEPKFPPHHSSEGRTDETIPLSRGF
jgi:2-phospho-L-lactate transferase/gluconeogenesis factor (CofD/UPF0052 family)